MRRLFSIAVVAFGLAPLLLAQSAIVRGRVLAEDGSPIVNARVALATATVGTPVVVTDDEGRFAIGVSTESPNSTLRLAIAKTGFGRTEIAVAPGQDVEIRLNRAAVVSGRITDQFGDGVQGARILVQRPPASANDPNVAVAFTDDRGEYRVAGLESGIYIISAAAIAGWIEERSGNSAMVRPRMDRVYFPDAETPSSGEPLRLAAGEERSRVDFVIAGARSLSASSVLMQPSPLRENAATKDGERPAVIRGRVVTLNRRSVPHAQLRLGMAGSRVTVFAAADGDGAFEFHDLPAGRYGILAWKAGYTMSDLNLSVEVRAGEIREGVDLTVRRWSAVAGRVVDERGEPLQGAAVQLLRVRFEAGRRRLVPAQAAAALTDDLGRYRVFDVAPGRYVVSAAAGGVGSAELPGYARVFYPNTTNAGQAQFVTVGESQDVPGIDLPLARARTARISGRLIDSSGSPTSGGSVVLLPARASASASYVGDGAHIDPDGKFEFVNVPPGSYVIHVSRGRLSRSNEGEFASVPVSVDGRDVAGLVVQTSAGSTVRGRLDFDTRDPAKRPAASAIELTLLPVDPDLSPASVASADIHPDWTFDARGVNGPRRLSLARVPDGWALKEIRVNGVDATDRPLPFGRADQSLAAIEVVLTDRVSELAVTVRGIPGPTASPPTIIVFSTDRGRWFNGSRFLRATPVAAKGPTAIGGMPFGTYYAAAGDVPDEGDSAWQDPEFLERVARTASIVTVREGERQSIDLQYQRGFSAR